MKRLAIALLLVLVPAASYAFDTARHAPRVGILHAPDSYDAEVSALVNRLLRDELRGRGFDAFDAGMTYAEARDGAGEDADVYVEIVGGTIDRDQYGGVGIGDRSFDVSMAFVVARVAADLRIYDGRTGELIADETLRKKSSRFLPTSVGVGGSHLFTWLALPFVEHAQLRSVARDAARDAATRVANTLRTE